MEDMCVTQLVLHIAATTPFTELHSSTIEVTTLDRAFNLDSCIICLILGGDIDRRTECRRMQIRHLLIELCRQEVGIVFVGRGFLPRPLRIKLCQHKVRDGKHTAHVHEETKR